MLFMPEVLLLNSVFDFITVTFISALIILSVLSLCFIFHLRLKSKSITHLQGFNSLWTVRFLLVLFIFLWAITELLRLPFFRHTYLNPFIPSFTVPQQANLCRVHIVLSLGFFEPAFLVILLFLLNASTRKKTPNDTWAITFVCITCLPTATLQTLLIFFNPLENRVPALFKRTYMVLNDDLNNETVLCGYPFLNSILFAGFGIVYATWFLFSCWRVLSLVINKGLRARIYGLTITVLVGLPLQIVSLGFTVLWNPRQELYSVFSLLVFLGAFCCATVGEGILVIKPISDALDAGGSCCLWNHAGHDDSLRHNGSISLDHVENRINAGEGCV
ncbi:uncharacterized protein LOC113850778 [Abrus precatorius]|uniref:Uncharacterized protein LOC113850778 n=1 Tax=Abrus precatorius TaxID=3816 RepID=A0A8B8K280_ABRPR|nr:uncharacterized protein LOC113850778 [Abrus precatorius]